MQFKTANVALAAGVDTSIRDVQLDNKASLGSIEVTNDGSTNPTTAFALQVQDHPNGQFYTLLSGSDWAAPSNFLLYTSTNSPAALAHGDRAHFKLDLRGIFAIRFQATSTSGTIISIRGTISTNPV